MLRILSDELSELTAAVLETIGFWKEESDYAEKERFWQQLVVLNELQAIAFRKLATYLTEETAQASTISKTALARLAKKTPKQPGPDGQA